MWALVLSLVEWLADFWFEKKPAMEQQKAQNAQNDVNALSDDAIAKRVSEDWTRR